MGPVVCELLPCGELLREPPVITNGLSRSLSSRQGHEAKPQKQRDVDGSLAGLEPIPKDNSLLGHSHICAIDKSAPGREGTSGEEMSLEAGLSLKCHVY